MLKSRRRDVVASDFSTRELWVRLPILVSHIREGAPGYTITAMFSDAVPPGEPFFLFVEVVNNGASRKIRTTVELHDQEGALVEALTSGYRAILHGRSPLWARINTVPLLRGVLTTTILALDSADTVDTLSSATRTFSIKGSEPGEDLHGSAHEQQIDRLRYVATASEINDIR